MKKIQIYVHGENSRDPKFVEVPETASTNELIHQYQQEFKRTNETEEVELFFEDEEEPKSKNGLGNGNGLSKRMHVHCHRCKKIETTISYNGSNKVIQFPPSTTAKKILKQVIKAFGISEVDAGDYLLKMSDATVLQSTDHIGSFASWPGCSVNLFLTPVKPVQG